MSNIAPTMTSWSTSASVTMIANSTDGVTFTPDGGSMIFISKQQNLVPGDTDQFANVFIKNLTTGDITQIDTDINGTPAMGGDHIPLTKYVFGDASGPVTTSADGNLVAFLSGARNLIAGEVHPTTFAIYVKNLTTGEVVLASKDSNGNKVGGLVSMLQAPSITRDGSKVVFKYSGGTVGQVSAGQIYVKDLTTNALTLVSSSSSGIAADRESFSPSVSPDGTKVVFASHALNLGSAFEYWAIYMKDLVTGTTSIVSTDSNGVQMDGYLNASYNGMDYPVFSPDGTKIAFTSKGQLYVKDLSSGALTQVFAGSVGGNTISTYDSKYAFSPDGTYIAFVSSNSIYLKNIVTGALTEILSNVYANSLSLAPDGKTVVFSSTANSLVPGDTDGIRDTFALKPSIAALYTEGQAAVAITAGVSVGDADSSNYNGGTVRAMISAGLDAADQLSIASSATPGTGIEVSGANVLYNGVIIGVRSGTASNMAVALNGSADDAAVTALINAFRFSSNSTVPMPTTRTVTFTLQDGGGTAGGGSDTASFDATINVVAVNSAPAGTDKTISLGTGVAFTLAAADFGFTDANGDSLAAVKIVSQATDGLLARYGAGPIQPFAPGDIIPIDFINTGNLQLKFISHAPGPVTSSFTFQVIDNGGTLLGGADTDPTPNTMTLNLTIPPSPPSRDFNADLSSDVLLQNSNGQAAIWFMNGTTVMAGSGNAGINPGSAWKIVATRDFNDDGKSDVVLQASNGQGAIWFMNGTTVMPGSGNVFVNPGSTWKMSGAGDFNGDTQSDLLLQHTSGQVAVWLMSGANVLPSSGNVMNPGSAWKVSGTGDFNGDGKSDAVLQNTDGTVAIWFMNGTTVLAGSGNAGVNPGTSWKVAGIGDFNDDGKSDILLQNDNGQVAVWLMNGTSVLAGSGNVFVNPGSDWKVAGIGDYNHDSHTDILLQNASGQAAVWFMNGTSVLSGSGNAGVNPGAAWQIIAGTAA